MHLISQRRLGKPLPSKLPDELIPPSQKFLTSSFNELKTSLTADFGKSKPPPGPGMKTEPFGTFGSSSADFGTSGENRARAASFDARISTPPPFQPPSSQPVHPTPSQPVHPAPTQSTPAAAPSKIGSLKSALEEKKRQNEASEKELTSLGEEKGQKERKGEEISHRALQFSETLSAARRETTSARNQLAQETEIAVKAGQERHAAEANLTSLLADAANTIKDIRNASVQIFDAKTTKINLQKKESGIEVDTLFQVQAVDIDSLPEEEKIKAKAKLMLQQK